MSKKRDLILLILWPILASLISFLINANFFVSILLFLGVPSVYLSLINQKYVKKILLFSLAFGLPVGIVVDYIMELTGGWYIPYSIFGSFRLFGFITLDILLWGVLETYLILIFYETFVEQKCTPELYSSNFKYLLILVILALGAFVLLYFYNPFLLNIDYFYLKMGLVMIILPVVSMLLKFPKFWNRFLNMGVYFFIFDFIYELTAVKLGQWSFPAENQFIGIVDIMGIRFAFEEIFFWMILTAMAIVAFYEFFDDDKK